MSTAFIIRARWPLPGATGLAGNGSSRGRLHRPWRRAPPVAATPPLRFRATWIRVEELHATGATPCRRAGSRESRPSKREPRRAALAARFRRGERVADDIGLPGRTEGGVWASPGGIAADNRLLERRPARLPKRRGHEHQRDKHGERADGRPHESTIDWTRPRRDGSDSASSSSPYWRRGVVVAQVNDPKKEGRTSTSKLLLGSGRDLNPAGKMTQLGNFLRAARSPRTGRFLWTLSAGRGKNQHPIVRVETGKYLPQGRARRACAPHEAAHRTRRPDHPHAGCQLAASRMVPHGCTAYVSGTLKSSTDYYKPPGTPGSRVTSSTCSATTRASERRRATRLSRPV